MHYTCVKYFFVFFAGSSAGKPRSAYDMVCLNPEFAADLQLIRSAIVITSDKLLLLQISYRPPHGLPSTPRYLDDSRVMLLLGMGFLLVMLCWPFERPHHTRSFLGATRNIYSCSHCYGSGLEVFAATASSMYFSRGNPQDACSLQASH